MVDAKLLEVKKQINKKRPDFIRQDYFHRSKVEYDSWRRPRGRHSKMRERRVGKRKRVDIGYRGPAEVRGLHFTGMKLINVSNYAQLIKINPKEELAIINARLGERKKYQLVKAAAEKNIKLFNIKDTGKFLSAIDAKLKAAKDAKAQKPTEAKKEEKPVAPAKPVAEKAPAQKVQTQPKVVPKTPVKPKEVAKK